MFWFGHDLLKQSKARKEPKTCCCDDKTCFREVIQYHKLAFRHSFVSSTGLNFYLVEHQQKNKISRLKHILQMACACWVLYRGLKSLQLFGGGTLNSTGSAIADLNLKSQGHYLIRGGVIECNSGVSGNVPISCRVLGSNPSNFLDAFLDKSF